MERLFFAIIILNGFTICAFSQCVLTSSTDTESEVISCLNSCGCSEIQIPSGVAIDMDGDWDLLSEGAISLTIEGSGSLIFSGAGGNRDELLLASGSVLIIEDTNNANALASSPPSGGNTRVEIGSQVYQGNDFSSIIDAGGADENGVLPITLSRFYARQEGGDIVVEWQSKSELNNDFYTLERSKNGLVYQIIANVDGAGTSSEVINYKYTDSNPLPDQSYYRLKQTDFDGTSETFKPISVLFNIRAEHRIVIFPNPTSSDNSLRFSSGFLQDQEIQLSIFNNKGELVYQDQAFSLEANIQLSNKLIPGLYVVAITSGVTRYIVKLIVQ